MSRRRHSNDEAIAFVLAIASFVFLGLVAKVIDSINSFFRSLSPARWIVIILSLLTVLAFFVAFILNRVRRNANNKTTQSNSLNSAVPASDTKLTPSDCQISPDASVREEELRPSPKPPATIDLHKKLHSIDWYQFEKLIAIAYRKQGYEVDHRGGANPDGGIDIIIRKDGLEIAIQCKHWKSWNVGVKTVREFLGALTASSIKTGYFISIGRYTAEAWNFADKHHITLMTENNILDLLKSADAEFDPEMLYLLNDTQKHCPKCGCLMALRTATRGAGAGSQFWGCSTYPRCRFTMQLS